MEQPGRLNGLRRDPVYLFGIIAFLLQYVNMLLLVATLTLFLHRVGTRWLPHTYVVLNLISIALQMLMLSRKNLSTFRLSVQLNVGLLILLVVSIPFLGGDLALFFFFLFLLAKIHDILCFSYFLTYTQSVFPVREAKKKVSLILGGASVSCILAGLSVRPLVEWLSMSWLFAIAAVLLAFILILQVLAGRRWPPPDTAESRSAEGDAEEEENALTRLHQAFLVLRRSPLAANVVQVLLLSTFLRYLVDFQYSKAISLVFQSEEGLASFIGYFNAFNSVVIMGVQFAFTGRLLGWLKTGGTMCLPPLLLMILSSIVVVWPAPSLVIAMQALFGIGFHTATRPAFAILLAPLEGRTRNRLSLLSSMAAALGSLSSGVVLVLLQRWLAIRHFFFVLALLYGLYLLIARRLDANYLEVLERRLASRDSETRLGAIEVLGYMNDERDLDALARLLTDPDPRLRHRALERLTMLPPRRSRPLLLGLLDREKDPRNLATLARLLPEILGGDTLPLLLDLLDSNRDPRVRANVLDALGHLDGERVEALLRRHLDDEHMRIRGSAILALARSSSNRSVIEGAMERLDVMIRAADPWTRATAAAVMGELRHACFAPCLMHCLADGRVEVRRNAVRALTKLRTAEALPRLRALADHDEVEALRDLARKACHVIEDRKLDELVRLASRLTQEERSDIGGFLRHVGGGSRMEVLNGLLRHPWSAFPVELLNRVRLCEDEALLGALADGLASSPPRLEPLARHLEAPATREEGELLPIFSAYGEILDEEQRIEVLDERLRLLLLLHLFRRLQPDATGVGDVDSALLRLRRRWLHWLAVLGSRADGEGREATARALEGASGSNEHLASISVDLLEHRLTPSVFAMAAPYLEALRKGDALEALARERLSVWHGLPLGAEAALAAQVTPALLETIRSLLPLEPGGDT